MGLSLVLVFLVGGITYNIQGSFSKRTNLNHVLEEVLFQRRQACNDPSMCRSQWGYCGHGAEYCGTGCKAGPCTNSVSGMTNGGVTNGDGDIINDQNFACAFNTIDAGVRSNRLNGLRQSGWKPTNKDEAAVFLAHVFHETDGLKTVREYCAPGLFFI